MFFLTASRAVICLGRMLIVCILATLQGLAAAQSVPFVDEDGSVSRPITYVQVVRAFGEPQVSVVKPWSWGTTRPRQRELEVIGGEWVFGYPTRGLEFVVKHKDHKDRSVSDPTVWLMRITRPAAVSTPQGLRLGMPQQEALQVVQSHYRVHSEWQGSETRTMQLAHKHGFGWHALSLTLQNGVLHRIEYDFQPPTPFWLALTMAAALIVAVGAAAAFMARLRQRVKIPLPNPGPAMRVLDLTFIILGGVALLAGGRALWVTLQVLAGLLHR